MFQSNVQEFDKKLQDEINSKDPDIIRQSIAHPLVLTKIDGKKVCIICKTCIRYLKQKKTPPMSSLNGLALTETDDEIKNQNLELTELEGALI